MESCSGHKPSTGSTEPICWVCYGVGSALAGLNPAAHALVNLATHQIGGVDESDPGYHNADAIGNGLVAGSALFVGGPEAEAGEGMTTLYCAVRNAAVE